MAVPSTGVGRGHCYQIRGAITPDGLLLFAIVVLALLVALAVIVALALDAFIFIADLVAVAVAIGLALDALLVLADLVAAAVPIFLALLLAQRDVAYRSEAGYPEHSAGEGLEQPAAIRLRAHLARKRVES